MSNDANRIHNALDKAFGETIISAAHNLSEMVGGVDLLTAAISGSGPARIGFGCDAGRADRQACCDAFGCHVVCVGTRCACLIPAAQGLGATLGGFLDTKLAESTSAGLKKLEADNKASGFVQGGRSG